MKLLKLGGSIITDRDKPCTFRPENATRLAKEIAAAECKIAIVHGAGSFGHNLAHDYSLHKGYSEDSQIPIVAQVQRDVKKLNLMILEKLLSVGVRAVGIAPSSHALNDNKLLSKFDTDQFKVYIKEGFVPVSFGDVVLDVGVYRNKEGMKREMKFSILSGDQILEELGKKLQTQRIISVTDVDGVFDSNPKTNPNARLLKTVTRKQFLQICMDSEAGSDSTERPDVTGAMENKLEALFNLADLGKECWVINGLVEGRLLSALGNEPLGETFIGTRVIS